MRYFWWVFFYCCFVEVSYAQLRCVGLPIAENHSNSVQRISGNKKYLTLPFFDDFSRPTGHQPDTALWLPLGGTFVGNGFAHVPPSVNTATFDGVDALGNPYDFSKEQPIGKTDSLVSHWFDLERIGSGNQVVFEFYWQAGGLGELPDETDSLLLQGYRFINDSTYDWATIWSVSGAEENILPIRFRKERVLMKDAEFFHPNFKFKFQSVGRKTGAFDTWQLDYVLVYVDGRDNPLKRIDIAMGISPNPIFKEYTAIPTSILLERPEQFLADTLKTSIHNLSDTINVIRPRCAVKELVTNTFLSELPTVAFSENGQDRFQENAFIGQVVEGGRRRGERLHLYALHSLNLPRRDSLKISYQFWIETGEKNELIPTRNNDTLTTNVVLKDFWAYDDGEAEYGIGINKRFGKLAYRFHTPRRDTLTHIDICFPKLGFDLGSENFNLFVWAAIDTLDERKSIVLHRQNVSFRYANNRNTFTRFALSVPVVVEGNYFIGFEQLGDLMLVVGYDQNTQGGKNVFYNVRSKWEKNQNFLGSMMIRPVFQKRIVTHLDNAAESFINIFPNPATTTLYIEGATLKKVIITNMMGKVCLEADSFLERLDIGKLENGLYIIQLYTHDEKSFTKKLWIAK